MSMMRLGRLGAGLFRLAVLAGLLAAVPYGLVTQIGWPLPRTFPGSPEQVLPQVQEWLTTPVTDQVVLNLLATAMWVLWGSFTGSAIVEIPARMRGVVPRRVPVLAPMQSLAGWLLSGITVGVLATGSLAAPAPSAADPVPAVSLVVPEAHRSGGSVAPGTMASSGTTAARGLDTASYTTAAVDRPDRQTEQLVHEVAKGDWMWHIAGRYLGDEERYPEIAELNPMYADRYDDYPDHIQPGDRLVLPPDAHDHGERPHATGSLAAPAETDPQPGPAPAQEPAEQPPASPGPPATPAPPPPDQTPPPSPDQTAPALPSPSAPTSSPTTSPAAPDSGPGEQPDAGQPDEPAPDDEPSDAGVVLPTGAWVSFGLAALITSAALLLRLHRRRRARLQTRPIPTGLAPAGPPLPESLRPVEDAGLRVLDFDRDDTSMPGLLPAPAAPAAVGVNVASEQVSLFDLPGSLIAVHGTGAESAVRAILAAALGTGVTEHTGVQPRVIIPTDTLGGLLPEGVPPVGLDPDGDTFDGERLEVVADEAAAVTRWEEEMFHRRRMCDQHDAETVGELVERDEHPEHLPPLVLITPATSRYLPRLRAVAVHRHALLLHTVLLGEPGGNLPGWQVDPDGITTDLSSEADETPEAGSSALSVVRLSTLGAEDLAAVLEVVAQVAPRTEPGHDDRESAEPSEAAQPSPEPAAETPTVVIPAPAGDEPPPVKLLVLGMPQLSTGTGPVTEGVRTGSVAVMALLAAHPGGLGLDEIATTLHPGVERPLARGRVHTDIDAARSLLRQATGTTGKARFVVYDSKVRRYLLDADLVEVDLWRMLTCVETANRADDDQTALAALREATTFYRRDFAAGFEQVWAVEYATTVRHTITQVWARIAEILEADQPDEAVAALESAIDLEPVNEELYRRLMRVHGRSGHVDRVRAALKLLERRLAELGDAEPSAATRRVADRQLTPPAGHAPAATAGPAAAAGGVPAMTGHQGEPVANR